MKKKIYHFFELEINTYFLGDEYKNDNFNLIDENTLKICSNCGIGMYDVTINLNILFKFVKFIVTIIKNILNYYQPG